MNDLTDENREPIRDLTTDVATLHVELHELRQSLAALQATLPQRQQTVRQGRRVTPKMLTLLAALALLAAATIVFGQDAVDALFVSKQGNVGIGTTDPGTSKLKVANSSGDFAHFRFVNAGAGELEMLGWDNGWNINTRTIGKNLYLNRDTSSDVWIGPAGKEMVVRGDTGKVGIATTAPAAKLDINGKVTLQDGDGRNYFKDGERSDGKGLRVGALWGQYGVFADKGMGALGGADGVTLQNGALTINGAGDTTMSGNATAASFNGDKPPYVFEVGNKADTTNWYRAQVNSALIKAYLGDGNGGTIRICLRVNNSDEVRTITETIYIEQPDKSNNANPGLHGWARQEGGGDTGFVLGTNAQSDLIPHPWDWIFVRNYSSPEANRGVTGPAWTGGEQYKFEFMTRPNVSATVIIYDR